VNDQTDPQLRRAYAESRSEAAFAELLTISTAAVLTETILSD
jgi:hypothetical protein